MTQKQLIDLYIEISKRTQKPALFMGGPGVGKTADITLWAQEHGYHTTVLIGSRHDSQDIGGYMVNDVTKDYLTYKNPAWYHEIVENDKNGTPTVLFLDELNQTDPKTMGALLDLCCGRTLECGKLPDSTIVLAAGNFPENVGEFGMEINGALMNRFMVAKIVNSLQDILFGPSLKDEAGFEPIDSGDRLTPDSIAALKKAINNAFVDEDFTESQERKVYENGDVINFMSKRTWEIFTKALDYIGIIPASMRQEAILSLAKGTIGGGAGHRPRAAWETLNSSLNEWFNNDYATTGQSKAEQKIDIQNADLSYELLKQDRNTWETNYIKIAADPNKAEVASAYADIYSDLTGNAVTPSIKCGIMHAKSCFVKLSDGSVVLAAKLGTKYYALNQGWKATMPTSKNRIEECEELSLR